MAEQRLTLVPKRGRLRAAEHDVSEHRTLADYTGQLIMERHMAEHRITPESILIVGRAMAQRQGFTVTEYAEIENVHPITVRRWIAKGALLTRRNPGGGIRIIGEKK